MKWSGITWGSTLGMSIHGRSWCHKEPKVPHERNKCCAFSTWPQPAMQKLASVKIMSRFTRFDLVGNMSQSNLKQKLKPSKHLSYKKKTYIYSNKKYLSGNQNYSIVIASFTLPPRLEGKWRMNFFFFFQKDKSTLALTYVSTKLLTPFSFLFNLFSSNVKASSTHLSIFTFQLLFLSALAYLLGYTVDYFISRSPVFFYLFFFQ